MVRAKTTEVCKLICVQSFAILHLKHTSTWPIVLTVANKVCGYYKIELIYTERLATFLLVNFLDIFTKTILLCSKLSLCRYGVLKNVRYKFLLQ